MYSTGTCDFRHLCASIGTYVPIKFMYPLSILIMHDTVIQPRWANGFQSKRRWRRIILNNVESESKREKERYTHGPNHQLYTININSYYIINSYYTLLHCSPLREMRPALVRKKRPTIRGVTMAGRVVRGRGSCFRCISFIV